ncbi:MAG: histidinol dehydrogenase [Chthoniobacterales bacterium]
MRLISHKDRDFSRMLVELNRQAEPRAEVRETVAEVIAAVRKKGDAALLGYSVKFGGPKLAPAKIRVTPAEIKKARASLTPAVRKALTASIANVTAFAKKSLRRNWSMKNAQGALVGERFDPLPRVGLYVPGGTAPLVSSAIMTCGFAKAAGVPEIVAVTPASKNGTVAPALLAALDLCGATEIYRVGGAQAIAALAYGTRTIRPVTKIFGPGNAYVVEAKRQVFGRVGIDLLPGPSEVLVIADAKANPVWVAADLLAQSEHGVGSVVVLLSDSDKLIASVQKEIARQSKLSSRPEHLAKAMANAVLVRVRDLNQAVEIANGFSAEHVSLAVRNPEKIASKLNSAGGIFLGDISPVAAGDFLAGPSHELPTGGAGKAFAGLTAEQFQRRTSIVRYDEASLKKSLPIIETFCAVEGLDAHGRSVSLRLEGARDLGS